MEMNPNNNIKEYVGINKRLLDRRLELDFSILEASIKLDISKRKLKLIEQGYIKVDPKLQKRIIHRYDLPEDFFSCDEYMYPTPIENPEMSEKDARKIRKFIASWKYKLVTGILSLGAIACVATGLSLLPKSYNDALSFYDNNVINVRNEVFSKGVYKDGLLDIDSNNTSSLIAEHFYSYTDPAVIPVGEGMNEEYYNATYNFFEAQENMAYTFFTLEGNIYSILGDSYVSFETRVDRGVQRIHFYESDTYDDLLLGNYYHVVADYDLTEKSWTYRCVEEKYNVVIDEVPMYSGTVKYGENDIEYYTITGTLERYYNSYREAMNVSMNNTFNMSYDSFENSLLTGNNKLNGHDSMVFALITVGLIAGAIFIALFILSVIVSLSIDDKISDCIGNEDVFDEMKTKSNIKDLPKNKFITPFVPECVIRVLALFVMFASSITLFAIYKNVMALNVFDVIDNVAFSANISTLFSASVILLFFIKLDIRQNQKNTFTSNYILFFGGLLFYFFLLITQFSIQQSQTRASNIIQFILDMMPGNIVWGILSFNLLSTFLFSNPTFNRMQKEKTIAFRLCALIPLAYLVISSVYSIGHKVAGWQLPLAVSSLLFSKALMLTLFACLYCLVVFLYKRHTVKKYGQDKAHIYQCGNRYYFIKNAFVCLILVALAVTGIILEKTWPKNPLGFDGGWILLICIPFVLFYHPHLGKRSGFWDFGFIGLYAISLLLGILLIVGDIGNAIALL